MENNIRLEDLNYEEFYQILQETGKTYMRTRGLRKMFGFHFNRISNYDNRLRSYGTYFAKLKNGYVVFEIDKEGFVEISRENIRMMDTGTAERLLMDIESYKQLISEIQHTVADMELLVETQKMRMELTSEKHQK